MCMSKRLLWGLALGLGLTWLPALLGTQVITQVASLYTLGAGPYPYFQPSHFWLLYVITPLVVASSFLLYLSPGAMLILALGQARSLAEWWALAFGTSLLFSLILGTGAKLIFGPPLTWSLWLPLWLLATTAASLFLVFRLRAGTALPWPLAQPSDKRRLLWILAASLAGVVALLPKIFWENFNLDGIEAFEFGRSLTNHLLPYWEIQAGVFGFYQNFLLFAYPNHWFISLFGPIEAAVRLPFLLYLSVLFCALISLVEHKQERALSATEEAGLWLGLTVFTIVQVYNTAYEPFFADLAENAATDTLWVTCFLLACYALWKGRTRWFWIFALMTYTASPGGLLLLGALAAAILLARSPHWRKHLRPLAGVILVCLLIGILDELIYNRLLLGGVNDQFSAFNMLRRFSLPTVTEFVRFNVLLFPSGLLPALSLLAVRRKDPTAWVLTVVTLSYFGVLYLQQWTSVHQFTPVMVLPLVVFWRVHLRLRPRAQRWLLPALATTSILALILSLPPHFQINQATREFGRATLYNIGDYEKSYERALRAGWSLYALLPKNYRLLYPEQPWGTDPAAWIYYATREKPPGTRVNYLVQPTSEPSPPGLTQVMAKDGVAVYVRDLQAWQRDRELELPRVALSPLYEPILRRSFQFFRAYAQELEQQGQAGTTPRQN